jgi:hypothetical protein
MNKGNLSTAPVLINSVVEILNQGETLLIEISDSAFTRKLPAAFNASIGAHYRHCLDHFQNLYAAAEDGDLNYDARQRNTLIETDRFAALNATRWLRENYQRLDADSVKRTLNVTCKTSYSLNASQVSASTVGREIMYIVAHAVHHYALIGIMGALMDMKMPDGFGVAPSTLKHQADTANLGAH